MSKLKFSGDWSKKSAKEKLKGVPLVITFQPLFKDFGKILYNSMDLLYVDQEPQVYFYAWSDDNFL